MSFFDDDAEVTQVTPPAPRSRRKRTTAPAFASSAWSSPWSRSSCWSSCWRSSSARASRTPRNRRIAPTSARCSRSRATRPTRWASPSPRCSPTPPATASAQLKTELNKLVAAQNEIATRTERISPPGKLKDPAPDPGAGPAGASGRRQQVRAGLLAALTGKNLHATARKLAALSGYFTGPDVYYNDALPHAGAEGHDRRRREQRGGARASATSPATAVFSPSALQAALSTVSSSTKLSGVHGVGLAGVAVKSNGKTTAR